MPIFVDRDQIRMDILLAFQHCIERKPLMNVSLRDIAAEAGMSHAKLRNYFESIHDLILAYVRYTREYMSEKCSQWFAGHDRADYASTLAYMNAETLALTIAEGRTVFWSRSRQEIWRKGETSGNVQRVVSITADCDKDALVVEVVKDGPACHTGAESCFFNEVYVSP